MGVRLAPKWGIAATFLLASVPCSTTATACGAAVLGEARVTAIENSRTLRLEDGRILRLAGVEWGMSSDAARTALSELVLGRSVRLKGSNIPDRYGRHHAFLFVNGSETPIQYILVDEGLAVTGTRIGDPVCHNALLVRERAARTAQRGIWGSGDYRLYQAGDPASIRNSIGRFAIVEGRVLSVRESGNTLYVNFGRRWSDDFTVTIAKRAEQHFISAGLAPRSLAGRTVRVRGVVNERSGPWIEATAADQFDWDGQR